MEKKKILIVDDDSNIRRLLSFMMEKAGFDFETAMDGEEGFSKAVSFVPNLILTDISMPNMNGFELISKLRTQPELASIKIIVITAKDQENDIKEMKKLGVTEFIAKPFNPKGVIKTISSIIEVQG